MVARDMPTLGLREESEEDSGTAAGSAAGSAADSAAGSASAATDLGSEEATAAPAKKKPRLEGAPCSRKHKLSVARAVINAGLV